MGSITYLMGPTKQCVGLTEDFFLPDRVTELWAYGVLSELGLLGRLQYLQQASRQAIKKPSSAISK
jgi:hypothetical protein